jgi:hypothetical protein
MSHVFCGCGLVLTQTTIARHALPQWERSGPLEGSRSFIPVSAASVEPGKARGAGFGPAVSPSRAK